MNCSCSGPRLVSSSPALASDEASRGTLPSRSFPLGMVLDACPGILNYAPDGIASWRDLVATAQNVRGWLGISPIAWDEACETLGVEDASSVICAVLQRGDAYLTSANGVEPGQTCGGLSRWIVRCMPARDEQGEAILVLLNNDTLLLTLSVALHLTVRMCSFRHGLPFNHENLLDRILKLTASAMRGDARLLARSVSL